MYYLIQTIRVTILKRSSERLTISSIVRKLSCREKDSRAIYITLAEAIRNHKPFLWAISRPTIIGSPWFRTFFLSWYRGFNIVSNLPCRENILDVYQLFQTKDLSIPQVCWILFSNNGDTSINSELKQRLCRTFVVNINITSLISKLFKYFSVQTRFYLCLKWNLKLK